MSLVNVDSITERRRLDKRLEASKVAVENYIPPTRRTSKLEPDLDYVEAEPSVVVDSCEVQRCSSQTTANEVVCYRCNQPGHVAKGCLMKANKFCCRCKKNPLP